MLPTDSTANEDLDTHSILLLLLLTANGFSPGGSGTTIRQQTKYKLTTIRQHTNRCHSKYTVFLARNLNYLQAMHCELSDMQNKATNKQSKSRHVRGIFGRFCILPLAALLAGRSSDGPYQHMSSCVFSVMFPSCYCMLLIHPLGFAFTELSPLLLHFQFLI
jgi:hypothetical protein